MDPKVRSTVAFIQGLALGVADILKVLAVAQGLDVAQMAQRLNAVEDLIGPDVKNRELVQMGVRMLRQILSGEAGQPPELPTDLLN